MENIIIKPRYGIGNINLGMSRDEVHELMGLNFLNIKKVAKYII